MHIFSYLWDCASNLYYSKFFNYVTVAIFQAYLPPRSRRANLRCAKARIRVHALRNIFAQRLKLALFMRQSNGGRIYNAIIYGGERVFAIKSPLRIPTWREAH